MTQESDTSILAHPNGAGEFLTPGEFDNYTVTHIGVVFKEDISEEEWLEATRKGISMFEGSRDLLVRAKFAAGDCLNFGEAKFGERYSQAIDSTRKAMRLSMKSLINDAWVAGSVPIENRHEMLSFAHHEVVAPLMDMQEQSEFLQRAEDEELSVAEFKKVVKDEAKSAPKPRKSGKGGAAKGAVKAAIDFTKLPGVIKALCFISEFFTDEKLAELSDDDQKELTGAIAAVVEQFGKKRNAKFHEMLCRNTAAFLNDNEEAEPIREWTNAKKKAWQPHLNDIAKAGRRAGVIGGAAPHRRGDDKE